ncbi:ATP-binding protein [Pseudonocardia nematodicida]|uniref:histidine kinase n=1 Tax=Pseudonocardia nematodicida TaxID=1206997 RepID=A0ABV1K4V9_9PSEU
MSTVGRTLLRHALVTAGAVVMVCGLVAAGVWWIAHDEAERRAEQVSRRVAEAVVVPLADRDLAAASPEARERLLDDLEPFRTVGMVSRVKVWLVEGPSARVVFSDEPRIEGLTRRFDPDLAARLDGGAAVVLAVPDDPEHRFERGGGQREVFLGFTDSAGRPARLEVYVPVDVEGATGRAVGLLVPPVVGGLLAIALAVLPLSVALARRRERDRAERRDAALYGLAAGELARRDLARRLHDDVLPGLASAGLMLDLATARPELVGRARATVGDGVVRIRSVLDGLVPDDVDAVSLPEALRRLAERDDDLAAPDPPGHDRASGAVPGAPGGSPSHGGPAGAGPEVTILVDAPGPDTASRLGDDVAALLHRITGELLRNVRAHASASRAAVTLGVTGDHARLTVADDGRGFDPTAPAGPGHIGLALVRRATEEAGGRVTVRSSAGAGTAVTVDLPTTPR